MAKFLFLHSPYWETYSQSQDFSTISRISVILGLSPHRGQDLFLGILNFPVDQFFETLNDIKLRYKKMLKRNLHILSRLFTALQIIKQPFQLNTKFFIGSKQYMIRIKSSDGWSLWTMLQCVKNPARRFLHRSIHPAPSPLPYIPPKLFCALA